MSMNDDMAAQHTHLLSPLDVRGSIAEVRLSENDEVVMKIPYGRGH